MEPSEDRSLPIKRWALGILAGGVALMGVAGRSHLESLPVYAAIALTIAVGLVLIFSFIGEPVVATRRMRAHPPSLATRLVFPSGLVPSVLFAVALATAALAATDVFSSPEARREAGLLWTALALATLGGSMGALAARYGTTRARVAGAALLAVFVLLVFDAPSRGGADPTWIHVLCPLASKASGLAERRAEATGLVGWTMAALFALGLMVIRSLPGSRRAAPGSAGARGPA
jgi:hypothetical protein